jgi:low affinity Fe/Cu permease
MAKAKKPDFFTRFSTAASTALGRPWIFALALLILIIWGASGPLLGFSDTWQLVINTSTTIVTFLMVFIIQNTQNRDNLALNIKLDAIMEKLKVTDEELFEAEREGDKHLEKKTQKAQRRARKSNRTH